MRQYHHVKCMFETFIRARATTKIVTEPDDIRGFDDLEESDQIFITETIDGMLNRYSGRSREHDNCTATLLSLLSIERVLFDLIWSYPEKGRT